MEKLNITTKNYDTVFKDALNKYKDDVIDFLGIECGKIIGVEPTELPEIEAYVNNTDYVFLLEDKSILHLEFQSEYDKEDIERFMLYDTRLYKKEKKKIKTIVVCKNSEKGAEEINGGSFKYRVEIKSLKGYSAEEIFKKDIPKEAELIFTPLMSSNLRVSERIELSIKKYKSYEKNEQKVIDFTAAILVMANRLLTRDEFNVIWEGIKMLNVIRFAEEKGIEEGIEKDRIIMAERLIYKNMSIEEVAEITELPIEKVKEIAMKRVV